MAVASRSFLSPVATAAAAPIEPDGSSRHDPSPFALDCLEGLSRDRKTLPCKWLYDDAGSQLFDDITTLEEYYPTRVEEALIEAAMVQIGRLQDQPATLVELGSGASRQTRSLLTKLRSVSTYVPIDISAEELGRAAAALRNDFPALTIQPLCADFTAPATLRLDHLPGPVLLFFPGSTLGNMAPPQAIDFLRALRERAPADTRLLLGVDLLKDEHTLCAAYDDAAGVTAAFNLNLLTRINRELDGMIDLGAFRHRVHWNADESRIEMHLEAVARQQISLLGRQFVIEAGETIHTENSYKLSARGWANVFAAAGWRIAVNWQSPPPGFLLALLEPDDSGVGE